MGSDSNDLLSGQNKAVYMHRRCLPALLKKIGLCQVQFAHNHHKIVLSSPLPSPPPYITTNTYTAQATPPGTLLLQTLTHLILILTLYGRYYYPHFTDQKMEA